MKIEPTQRGLHVSVQDPRVIDFFSERRSILRAQGEIREHLTLSFRSNKHTDVGWLRHAYLALFAFCGDECLDWPSLEIVRQHSSLLYRAGRDKTLVRSPVRVNGAVRMDVFTIRRIELSFRVPPQKHVGGTSSLTEPGGTIGDFEN